MKKRLSGEAARILVPHGNNKKIALAFNVSGMMVSKALHGKGNTKLAQKIRHVALTQYNGVEINNS